MIMHPFPNIEAAVTKKCWSDVAGGSAVNLAEPETETQFFNYNTNLLSASETDVN